MCTEYTRKGTLTITKHQKYMTVGASYFACHVTSMKLNTS